MSSSPHPSEPEPKIDLVADPLSRRGMAETRRRIAKERKDLAPHPKIRKAYQLERLEKIEFELKDVYKLREELIFEALDAGASEYALVKATKLSNTTIRKIKEKHSAVAINQIEP